MSLSSICLVLCICISLGTLANTVDTAVTGLPPQDSLSQLGISPGTSFAEETKVRMRGDSAGLGWLGPHGSFPGHLCLQLK